MSWFEIWFWKPIMEFLGSLSLVIGLLLLVVMWTLIDTYILSRYRNWQLKRLWKQQTREWRIKEYARLLSSSSAKNWPTSWQREMVEADKKQ